MLKKYALLAATIALAACGGAVGNKNVPQPAKEVELSRYLGKWYEIARYEHSFEKGCENVSAEYSKRDDGLIKVLNTCYRGGAASTADGKAKPVEGSGGAKLKVSFFGPFYIGDYWVLDRAEDYSWSIVGEPSGRYLWILARQENLNQKQKSALWQRVKELGYDTSLLIEVKHYPQASSK